MRVEFAKAERGGSYALIDRPDGVRLRMASYDRKSQVPHDLTHFVVERTLGLQRGIWGSIAAGAVFGSMEAVAGRLRHDRHERSRAVLRANRAEIGMAELLAGIVQRGVEHGGLDVDLEIRRAWRSFRAEQSPFPAESTLRAVDELRNLADRWAGLAAGATLAVTWPHVRSARAWAPRQSKARQLYRRPTPRR